MVLILVEHPMRVSPSGRWRRISNPEWYSIPTRVRISSLAPGYSPDTGQINYIISFMGRYKRNNVKDLKHESYRILCRCICIEGNADVCKQSAPLGGRGRRTSRKNFCPDQCPVSSAGTFRAAEYGSAGRGFESYTGYKNLAQLDRA